MKLTIRGLLDESVIIFLVIFFVIVVAIILVIRLLIHRLVYYLRGKHVETQ
jgi:uncharacterized protein HemY